MFKEKSASLFQSYKLDGAFLDTYCEAYPVNSCKQDSDILFRRQQQETEWNNNNSSFSNIKQ